MPARYGDLKAPLPAILDPVRLMAHGCASTAWTLGFYALHNWMLALFSEQAQSEAFRSRPLPGPAPLAPTGRGVSCDGGIRLSGRWSWATGVMDGNWIIVGALRERVPGDPATIYPVLALLPIDAVRIEDVWHTDGMRATGSNDVVIADAFRAGAPTGGRVGHLHRNRARGRATQCRHLPVADGAGWPGGRWCRLARWPRCPPWAAQIEPSRSTPSDSPSNSWPTRG